MDRRVGKWLATSLENVNARVWTWLERASWIWIVLGVPLFFVEHHLQLDRDRATATLEFVKRYQDSQLVSERFALLAPWMQYNIEEFRQARPSPQAVEDLVLKLVNASPTSGGRDMREAIFSIVDFYETLQLCVDAGRCDRELALSYFGMYAKQFYCLYKPYVFKLRHDQNIPTYAQRLEQLAQGGGACDRE
jgi:hypothetical protein